MISAGEIVRSLTTTPRSFNIAGAAHLPSETGSVNVHWCLHTSETTGLLRLLRLRAQQIVPMIHRLGIALILTPKNISAGSDACTKTRARVGYNTHLVSLLLAQEKVHRLPHAAVLQI